MNDAFISNCTLLDGTNVDLEIRDGVIENIVPAGDGHKSAFESDIQYAMDGRLVTPTLTEPHTHLFNSLTEGNPHTNDAGTLEQAWRTGRKNTGLLDKSDIRANAKKIIEWFISYGVLNVRTHLGLSNAGESSFDAAEVILDLQSEYSDVVDIQIVAIPPVKFFKSERKTAQFKRLLEMGIDVVGGIPHREAIREEGVKHIETALDMADEYDLPVDFHIDETDDPQSRYTEVLVSKAADRGIAHKTTASHVTAMHSYPDAYADKLSRLLAAHDVNVVTNPLTNAVLQGRYDKYPKRRGYTRFDQLIDDGVTVGIGQDDIGDAANPYGDGDPLKTLFFFAHYAQKNRLGEEQQLWKMLVKSNAEIFSKEHTGVTLSEGMPGSIVAYDAASGFEAIRTIPPRTLVMSDGEVVAESERSATIHYNEIGSVDYGK